MTGTAARIALIDSLSDDEIRAALAHVAEHAPEAFAAATAGRGQRQSGRLAPAGSRFRCALGEPGHLCTTYARVTITDALGDTARGCVRHSIDALDHITDARINWDDIPANALNEYELRALRMTEEQAARRSGGAR